MIYPCSAIFFRASVSMICIALPLVAMIFLSAKAESVRIALLVVMLDISAISARLMLISILSFSSVPYISIKKSNASASLPYTCF